MKKYYGGYDICEAMGLLPEDYAKVISFLSLVEAPMEESPKCKGVKTYCLTEKQIDFLKKSFNEIKKGLLVFQKQNE